MTSVQELLCETQDVIDLPDLDQINSAVSRLDGDRCTMVLLKGEGPDSSLSIGGGRDGHYVVCLTHDNRRFFTLLNPNAVSGKLSLVCGGQRGDFDAAKCADRATMLQAVRTFATTGERDTSLRWSRT